MSTNPLVPTPELERLEFILGGYIFFQTLRSAIDLELFTLLARQPGMSLKTIADLTSIERQPMRILLLGCVALGLIEKQGDSYFNRALAETHLNRDSPENIIAAVNFAHHLIYRPMFHMLESIRQNRNVGLV